MRKEEEKVIKTIISVSMLVIAIYLFVKLIVGLYTYDDDAILIYGFSLFGLVNMITMIRITLNDLYDIWRKKKK